MTTSCAPIPATRVPSVFQLAIYADVMHGRGNTVVCARAGSGKTTTIMGALAKVAPGLTIGLFAFNTDIARELASRAPPGVEVKTLHAHGFSACKRAFKLGKDALVEDKSKILCVEMFGAAIKDHPVRGYYYAIGQLVTKAKDTLVARGDLETLDELVDRFGIECPDSMTGFERFIQAAMDLRHQIASTTSKVTNKATARKYLLEHFGEPVEGDAVRGHYGGLLVLAFKAFEANASGFDAFAALSEKHLDEDGIRAPAANETDREKFLKAAMAILERSAEVTHIVDFADMCWLPVVRQLRVWAYDRVFVDETQDLSPSQIELLLMCVKPRGRICVIGDDRQAIYAFRGADVNTIPNLIKRLRARVLPLSVTYRCALAIVKLAQTEVADFQAAENAVEGEVVSVTSETMMVSAQPGDMIISRANAPLMACCLKFLKAGKRAAIKGKDVGEGIIRLIEKSETVTVPSLVKWVEEWKTHEVARLLELERPTDEVTDRYECVLALTEGVKTVAEVIDRARTLFIGDKENGVHDRITLGTTHKLKGLESDRVWMLEDTYRRQMGGEEANCWYVACTRAKRSLFMVKKPPSSGDAKTKVLES